LLSDFDLLVVNCESSLFECSGNRLESIRNTRTQESNSLAVQHQIQLEEMVVVVGKVFR
jgi:hypothetical protein